MRLALISLAVVLAGPAPALANSLLTPRHVARLRFVREAKISPDGTHVAYALGVPRDLAEDDDGPARVHLYVVDGNGSRPYVTGDDPVSHIAWIDAERISFLAKRGDDEKAALWVISLRGGEARKILEGKEGIDDYCWDPEGKRVAYLTRPEVSEEKQKLIEKGFDQEVFEEDVRGPQLWVATPGTRKKPRRVEVAGTPSDLLWGPGNLLACALAPTPHIDDHYMRRKLCVVNIETGEVERRYDNAGKLGDFSWSPDGKHLAVIASVDPHDPSPGHLMIGSLDGETLRDVTPRLRGHLIDVEWVDSSTVLYGTAQGVETKFAKHTLGQRFQVGFNPSANPVIRSFSISRDGKHVALIGDSSRHPDEVFVYDPARQSMSRLTHSNPWLEAMQFAPQEVVRYQARDGLELEGILVRPLGIPAGERAPLIVVVHGGPESHYSNGWVTWPSEPGQVAAGRGFAVFYPNYRASTGRGVEFSKLDHGDFAGKEFDDLVDGVDHLVEMGLVDKNRVGVTGGSYGGYASAWCATALTERFAAAVMSVGISDQVSFVGTTDIPNEMVEVHYRKRPWEDWDLFRERSPISHTPQARTPILILHGKEDTRVHPSQSLELYRYLKAVGRVPVRLVLYPGEGHGNRRAASRLDYNLRMMRWMEHYLKGEGGDPPPYEIDPRAHFEGP